MNEGGGKLSLHEECFKETQRWEGRWCSWNLKVVSWHISPLWLPSCQIIHPKMLLWSSRVLVRKLYFTAIPPNPHLPPHQNSSLFNKRPSVSYTYLLFQIFYYFIFYIMFSAHQTRCLTFLWKILYILPFTVFICPYL